MSENKIYHYYLTRAEYETATKSDHAIYFVAETDGCITLYKGTQRVSNAIRLVESFPQTGESGVFYLQPSTGIIKIWVASWVQVFPARQGGGGEGGPAYWGEIEGDISEQTDLQNALEAKANAPDTKWQIIE